MLFCGCERGRVGEPLRGVRWVGFARGSNVVQVRSGSAGAFEQADDFGPNNLVQKVLTHRANVANGAGKRRQASEPNIDNSRFRVRSIASMSERERNRTWRGSRDLARRWA